MIGHTISHYRVHTQLGAGGMGVVYGGDDTRLGRPVALKFVPEALARDLQAVERFGIEARTASGLNHPNICTIYDIGEYEGRPFIVMEWLKGQTLEQHLARSALKPAQIVDIGIQIADALDAAHSQGIVHRDIKPGNLFLTDRGQVKVMDFGLAKLLSAKESATANQDTAAREALTVPGLAMGTVAYMSPEQAVGEEIDIRSDIFSVGIVLYECATGQRPFTGNTHGAILASILNRAPVAPIHFNPDIPIRLQEVINNCLEKDRGLRYQTAADLRADLRRVKRDLDSGRSDAIVRTAVGRTAAAPVETPASSARAPQRSRLYAIAAVIIALAAGAGIAALLLRSPDSSSAGGRDAAAVASLQNRIELGTQSLKERQYRSALSHAEAVLAVDPAHARARAIRDEASGALTRFDEAIENARARIKVGDAKGAEESLNTARTIDPSGPGIADVSALLADRFKDEAEAARQELQRSRAAAPVKPPAPAAKPAPPLPEPQRDVRTEPPPQLPRSSPVSPAPPPPPPPTVRVEETPKPVVPEPIVKPTPAPAPAPPPPVERRDPAPTATAPAPVEDDDAVIRRVIATYGRALETKDLALFRKVKPNLSTEEERRVQQGFRSVTSQEITITVQSIDRRGDRATVRLQRHDVITAGGRRQTADSQQTMTLAKTNGSWVIVEIGR